MTTQTFRSALVLGGTGFIGRSLTERLLSEGYDVSILARSERKAKPLQNMPITIHYGDLTDKSSLYRACKGVDVVFNCAGLSSDWGRYSVFKSANVEGVSNLIDAVRDNKNKKLIHLSTSDVYGYPSSAVSESYGLRDVGLPYNRSKVEGEKLLWQAREKCGLPVTVFRPASVYGPRSMEWVVTISKLLLDKEMVLLSGGKSHAGLIYVDNLARVMIKAAENSVAEGKAYNIRDTGDETWRDFVFGLAECFHDESWKCTNVPAPIAYGLGFTLEKVYGLLNIQSRPLLTRHAVNLLSKTQSFAIDHVIHDLRFESWTPFRNGMELTRQWMRSEEGQACICGDKVKPANVYAYSLE